MTTPRHPPRSCWLIMGGAGIYGLALSVAGMVIATSGRPLWGLSVIASAIAVLVTGAVVAGRRWDLIWRAALLGQAEAVEAVEAERPALVGSAWRWVRTDAGAWVCLPEAVALAAMAAPAIEAPPARPALGVGAPAIEAGPARPALGVVPA